MNMKVWAYLGIVLALLAGIKWAYSSVYRAGWNAAIVEQERLIIETRERAVAETREAMQKLVDAAEGVIVREEVIVEKISKVPVTKIVKEIVSEQPDCRYDDLARLFSSQAAASRGGEIDSANFSGQLDYSLQAYAGVSSRP